MKNLATSLEMVHKAMRDQTWDLAEARLKRNVTAEFSKLAGIVNYDGLPRYRSEDDNYKEDDNEDDEGEDGDYKDGKNTKMPGKLQYNDTDDSSSGSSNDDSSNGSSSDSSTDNGSEKVREMGKKMEMRITAVRAMTKQTTMEVRKKRKSGKKMEMRITAVPTMTKQTAPKSQEIIPVKTSVRTWNQ